MTDRNAFPAAQESEMSRLTRAETQQRNRARVLAAARAEFTERGFRDAKIDSIAERAELTRGAVYSNFSGKRALYFTILAEDARRPPGPASAPAGRTRSEALGALARAWTSRLPLVTDDEPGAARLGWELLSEVLADEPVRQAFAQLMKLEAIVLGLALERLPHPGAPPGRLVRLAEAALTTLYGASQMSAAAPGFAEPFDVIRACEHLAGLDLGDRWPPPHLSYAPQPRPEDRPWSPPPAMDAVRGEQARLARDGVVAIVGLHRLAAAEEAVRAAPRGAAVTAVLVTGSPEELAPLARLAMADLSWCLRQAFPLAAWPGLQLVLDDTGTLAAAAGVPAISDATETAVRVTAGRIVARAEGFGACYAAATVTSAPASRVR